MSNAAPRGFSHPSQRQAECKDCLREVIADHLPNGSQFFTYPETWAHGQIERGGSRSDRCQEHRARHRTHTAGISVAYIDLETTGEVSDRDDPTGPLGGLGPLPPAHRMADTASVDLGTFGFGMDETHVTRMLESLADPDKRVLVVKAGTGTGKSTYMPYKLLDPPAGCFRLADLGPIVVTEPRVQATIGVASFVGAVMSGAGGVGPGYPVGYQVSGDRQHDAACQLIYVTDGTMINWLREGRLSAIGTVIVDEAHERSTNIDFILGYLQRELDRYPHLRVIITSATFDTGFYQQYFGEKRTGVIEVLAAKSIGYGWPLFAELDARPASEAHVTAWERTVPELRLADSPDHSAVEALLTAAWPRYAPPLTESEVRDPADIGYIEDLHATTRALIPLRFIEPFPVNDWPQKMAVKVGEFVVRLVQGLDKADVFGDILAFLPTGRAIEEACAIIRSGLSDSADVCALLSSLPAPEKVAALAPRRKGDRRKIVVSTNLAETSLTVEGVRFVVDSGLIAQSEWDVDSVQGGIRTKPHSRAGMKQRWGRVGRKAPGWVFPLYAKEQLLHLSEDTAPGSTRENLESLVMTAKLGGLASVHDIEWPAAFLPQPPVVLDESAMAGRAVFVRELERAETALRTNGSLDRDGDPTPLGKELSRLQVLGSSAAALAVIHADRLACVPEVVTILSLLEGKSLVGTSGLLLSDFAWPDEWRVEAAQRHRALASICEDDAELVLQITAGWERADPQTLPWLPSATRAAWAARWWVNHDVLLAAAMTRRDVLATLSPAMKEEVKRLIEPALLRRARGAITRAFASLDYGFDGTEFIDGDPGAGKLQADTTLVIRVPGRSIPLQRRRKGGTTYLANFVTVETWARDDPGLAAREPASIMSLLVAARQARAESHRDVVSWVLDQWPAGTRAQLRFTRDATGQMVIACVLARYAPAPLPSEAEELAHVDADHDAARGGGTPLDASPELDSRWPAPLPPVPDLAEAARHGVLDHRETEAEEYACRECPACLRGDLTDCAHPDVTPATSALGSRTPAGIDLSTPAVAPVPGSRLDDGKWYEVVGYALSSTAEPTVLLTPDWRSPEHGHNPGEHLDLIAGDRVPLVVGEKLRDHHEELRVLRRADGRGRFLLRAAPPDWRRQAEHAQLAVSLHNRDVGQLDDLREGASLVGIALPHSRAAHFTVTLLDLAACHVEKVSGAGGRAVPAVIDGKPNARGYVQVRLLAVDSSIGLRHLFYLNTGQDAPAEGSPVLVDLRRTPTRLSLQGRPLSGIRVVVDRCRDIRSVGFPASGEPGSTGTSDTFLQATRLMSVATATELAGLDLDSKWARDVWLLWARSRQRDAMNLRAGELSTPLDVPARPRIDLPTEVRLPADQVRDMHPHGSHRRAVVIHTDDDLNRAWLRLTDGVPASIAANDVPDTKGAPLSTVLQPGQEINAVVIGLFDRGGKVSVTLATTEAAEPHPHSVAEPPALLRPGVFQLTTGTDPGDLAEALRESGELTIGFSGLPFRLIAAYAAYALGLAAAVPGGKAEWTEPDLLVVSRPYPPTAPPAAWEDRPEHHAIRSFDGTINVLARQVRLGQSIEIHLHDAIAPVRNAVRLFLAGLCVDLPVNLEFGDDESVLYVYRR